MKKLLKLAAVTAISAGVVVATAAPASAASISTTGAEAWMTSDMHLVVRDTKADGRSAIAYIVKKPSIKATTTRGVNTEGIAAVTGFSKGTNVDVAVCTQDFSKGEKTPSCNFRTLTVGYR